MDEKEKHPWKPPELAPPMPDFDDFPISAWLKTPPILPKGLYPDEKNYTAMAIVKKWAGNNGNYNNIFRKFIPEMAEEEKAAKKAKKAQKAEK